MLPQLVEKLRGLTRKDGQREQELTTTTRRTKNARSTDDVSSWCLRAFVLRGRWQILEYADRRRDVGRRGFVGGRGAARRAGPRRHRSVHAALRPVRGDRHAFGSCCSIDDLHDARRVAAAIDIPHYILNFERQFNEQVVSNFVSEYAAGRTPLPCAHCNSDLKFATLLERARGFGADAVATGHYARVERDARRPFLLRRGVDPAKDQSYFLFSLTQDQLARAVFPVGDRPKDTVRAYARGRGLPVADKPDSQEICFIPDHDYAAFVTRHSPDTARAGAIVDESGTVVGHHDGIHRFTVGQRKGLGLAASPTGARRVRARAATPPTGRSSSVRRRRSSGRR